MGPGLTRMYLCLLAICCVTVNRVSAQTPEKIVDEINAVNRKVTNANCESSGGMLISNKAMNIFLSNKVSSYLSDNYDLSLYKNYVTLNAAAGSISVNHNFHQPVDSDDLVRSFTVIGARAGIANTYAGNFADKYTNSQLGFALQQTWMGRPHTLYDCRNQKQDLDADRAILIQELAADIARKAAAFENGLLNLNPMDVPGQDLQTVKNKLRQNFYTALKAEYLQNFAQGQSDLVVNNNRYKWVTDNWTTVGVYLPVIPQKFEIAAAGKNSISRFNYPLEIFVTHTRFWDSPKAGRFFFTITGKASVDNSVQGGDPDLVIESYGEYEGTFCNYITPAISGKIVYIPADSHVGLSFKTEKNFGTYHALNSMIGIPIVLIDKKGVPAVNFEAQIGFSNINHTPLRADLSRNKTFVGLTLGVPFSKIVY
jgi:hypothetical protein